MQPPGTTRFHTLLVPEPSVPLGVHLRTFLLRLPPSYAADTPHPVLLDIHGFTSDGKTQSERSGFAQVVDRHGFIAVWPDGSNDSPSGTRGWNCLGSSFAGESEYGPTCNDDRRAFGEYECFRSCGDRCQPRGPDNLTGTCLSTSCWDDVGFIGSLMDWLEEHLCVNVDRVHLSGLSNGAMMNYQLAHSFPDRVASMVPVAGLPLLGHLDEAVASRPTAVMAVHGLLDPIIPANISTGFLGKPGPHGSTWSSDGFYYVPIDNLTAAQASVNRCGRASDLRVRPTKYDGDLWCVGVGGSDPPFPHPPPPPPCPPGGGAVVEVLER